MPKQQSIFDGGLYGTQSSQII